MGLDNWIEITNGSYKKFNFHIANPVKGGDAHGVTNVQKSGGRRVQVIKRPFVDGARTKDMGREPWTITMDVIFFGENYLAKLKDFEDILNEGTSGNLIIPDHPEVIKATFTKIDKNSRAGETRSKTVRVTFIEDQVIEATDQGRGAVDGLLPKSLLDAGNTLDQKVQEANELINNNQIIATVRQLEAVTGQASNAFINAVGLTDQVRGRIQTTISNLTNSFDTMTRAKDQLLELFGVQPQGSGFQGGQVDPETGNPISDGLSDDTLEAAEDPLVAPETEPDATVEPTTLETAAGLEKFQEDMLALLDDSTEQLGADTKGRTEDVTGGTNEVANAFRDVIQAALPAPRRLVQTPFELSLAEVLFQNGVDLINLSEVYTRNTFIDDIHIVPKGTVIEL